MASTAGHSRPAALQGNNTASLRAPIMSSDTTFNGVEHNTATAAVTSSNLPHSAKFETAASSSFPSLCMSSNNMLGQGELARPLGLRCNDIRSFRQCTRNFIADLRRSERQKLGADRFGCARYELAM